MENPIALLTGAKGLLGPVWMDCLKGRNYTVFEFSYPLWNLIFPQIREDMAEKFHTDVSDYELIVPNLILHNAAIDPKPGADDGTDPFRKHAEIMEVNHRAIAHLNELFIPRMIKNGGGVIIIIGSIMGYISANPDNYTDGWTKAFAYNESKAALQMHCHNINTIYGKDNIRCVMPSFGPYEEGLSDTFMDGFGKKIPMQKPVSRKDLELTLNYCIDCESLAGEFRIDGGYTRVGR